MLHGLLFKSQVWAGLIAMKSSAMHFCTIHAIRSLWAVKPDAMHCILVQFKQFPVLLHCTVGLGPAFILLLSPFWFLWSLLNCIIQNDTNTSEANKSFCTSLPKICYKTHKLTVMRINYWNAHRKLKSNCQCTFQYKRGPLCAMSNNSWICRKVQCNPDMTSVIAITKVRGVTFHHSWFNFKLHNMFS